MAARDPLPHFAGCPRRLVLPRRHPDGRRTLTCWSCGAQVTYSADWRILATHEPATPPAWARIPEESR